MLKELKAELDSETLYQVVAVQAKGLLKEAVEDEYEEI